MSDIKELYNRDIPHSHLGRFNTLNLSVILNFTNKVNAIQIKIAANYFMDIKKVILHLIWRGKRHSIANAILKRRIQLKDRYYSTSRVTVKLIIKTVQYKNDK